MAVSLAIQRLLKDVEVEVKTPGAVVEGEYTKGTSVPVSDSMAPLPIGNEDKKYINPGAYDREDRKFYKIGQDDPYKEKDQITDLTNNRVYIIREVHDRRNFGNYVTFFCKVKQDD